ncbi:MAG: hypothetical protein EBU46_17365, partial [Nitrosomonadaceae bacterium]|nr:hypothetical protein [Nitrosomonadaceae bacterium]
MMAINSSAEVYFGGPDQPVGYLRDMLESRIAAASPLGDPHIYDTKLFPWVGAIEREWDLVRAELDRVM